MKKPRVGVDVDGVLLDLYSVCFKLMGEMFGKEISIEQVTEWDLDRLIPKDRIEEFWLRLGQPGICRNLKPYPGAVEGMADLRRVADVYLVTSYLHDAVQWVHERDHCVYEHFQVPRSKMVHTKAKYVFAGRMLVDDKPLNVEEWAEEHELGVPVLWTLPYNVNAKFKASVDNRVVRTNDWKHLVDMVDNGLQFLG